MIKIFKLLFPLIFSAFCLEGKPYKGGEIRTMESFLYGRFEVKMKSARGSGIVSSFFTFYDQPDFQTNWNEIDIEILGRYENEIQFNGIVGKHVMHEHRQKADFNPHSDFHVYAFDWTPAYIAWYIDGKEVYRQDGDHVREMNRPQKLMMNFWASDFIDWTGPFDDSRLPLRAEYDYVKYSAYDTTAKVFTPQWSDDFDKFDAERWALASHTFDGNKVDFAEENVFVKNGLLVLKLSKAAVSTDEPGKEPAETGGKGEIEQMEVVSQNQLRIHFGGATYAAQTKKKYLSVEGLEILKLKLHNDLRTLDIWTSPMELDKEYELKYLPEGKNLQTHRFKGR